MAEQMGVKNGSFYVKKGEPVTLSLGSGFLFIKSEGTQFSGCFDVRYWEEDIKPIGGVFSSSYINVTKNSGSGNVTIGVRDDAAQYDYDLKYIFIG